MAARATGKRSAKNAPEVKDESTGTAETAAPTGPNPGDDIPAEAEKGFASKTVLIPYMLLMLRDSVLHGYAIWEKLSLMGIPGLNDSDRASIYRVLRQLEREGKVQSEWDTTSDGPARRIYRLTNAGESFLQVWAVGLDQYRQSLDFFFKLYTGAMPPNPFGFNFQAPAWGTNSKEGKKE
jgi:poly-beta-hydroxybutyrate-responsive repressor